MQSAVNIFTETSHADRGKTNMKHIKWDLSLKALQQHYGSKYFDVDPPWPWGSGSKGQNLTFSEHGHVAYQIKGNHGSHIWEHILS